MHILFGATFLVCAVIAADKTAAWGDLGHEIICEIALREIDDHPAKAGVSALMEGDPQFRSFAKACTFPDHPRIRANEHFVNLPRDAERIGAKLCPIGNACVVTAILGDIDRFEHADSAAERLLLLKTLGHWVGDIHQPLHVSFEGDRGGNRIKATGSCAPDLHGVWDNCILRKAHGKSPDPAAVAAKLQARITAQDRARWISQTIDSAAVAGWANESFEITRRSTTEYCVQKEGACWYSDTQREFDGTQKEVSVGDEYLARHADTVSERLKMAGVRLGAILKRIFSDEVVEDLAGRVSADAGARVFAQKPSLVNVAPGAVQTAPAPGADRSVRQPPVIEFLDATLWVQTAAEYSMAAAQSYILAAIRLNEALADRNWTALPAQERRGGYQDLPPAVVLDVDETILNNSAFQGELIAENSEFKEALWDRWVNLGRATPVRGALEFCRKVHDSKVRMFYVTNRSHAHWQATLHNLKQLGFPVEEDGSNLLSQGKQEGWGPDKESRRAFLAETFRVILLLGDDLNDFAAGVRGDVATPTRRREIAERNSSYWGIKWIIVPNPMYGSWESAFHGPKRLEREDRLRRKIEHLDRF